MKKLILILLVSSFQYGMLPPERPITPYSEPPIGLQDALLDFDSDEENDLRQKLIDGPRAMPVIQLIEIMQKMAYLTGCSNPDC